MDLKGPIAVLEYPALRLPGPKPQPLAGPILAQMYRGNQMAFNPSGNLCIAGFIDEDVQCFDRSSHVQTKDYKTEIHAAGLGIEPCGLAFDSQGRLYLSSIFTGQVVKETQPGGPIVALATLTTQPNLLNGNLLLSDGELIVPTFFYPAPTVSTPDAVYAVSTATGAITNLITGGAPPLLGNDHLWGAQWVTLFTPAQ